MANTDEEMILSSDLYDIYSFTNKMQAKFTDIPENTLMLSTFGYLTYNFAKILQNAIIMASEYSNEAIPTRAQFAKNVITHALSLGIDDICATPAHMQVLMAFPKEQIENNLIDHKFVFDKDIPIYIGDYEFHVDYDIILTKNVIGYNEGTYVYSAKYDPEQLANEPNPVSTITSEYLPSVGESYVAGVGNMLMLPGVIIRQVTDTKTYKKIMSDNAIENKTLMFDFEDQLAGFNVEVNEASTRHILTPVYEGLYDYKHNLYCNYSYLNTNTIRVMFNSDSYEPKINADVTIHAKTTKGSAGNFTFNEDIMVSLTSEKFRYKNIEVIIKPTEEASLGGDDSKSISDLKKIIPKEALARGTITTNTDLENFFNSLNTDKIRLYFRNKIHNHITHSFYSYLLMKNENNQVIPTNTLDAIEVSFKPEDGTVPDDKTETVYIVPAGSRITLENGHGFVNPDPKEEIKGEGSDKPIPSKTTSFDYITPFNIVIGGMPQTCEYMLDIIDISKYTLFDFVNQNSIIQYICSTIHWERGFISDDRMKYTLSFSAIQNLNIDLGLVPIIGKQLVVDDNGDVEYDGEALLRPFLVFYNSEGIPLDYIEGRLTLDGSTLEFTENTTAVSIIMGMKIDLYTDGSYKKMSTTSTLGIKIINEEGKNQLTQAGTYYPDNDRYMEANMKAKIFIYGKSPEVKNPDTNWKGQPNWDGSFGRQTDQFSSYKSADSIIPGMEGYTLYNIYEVNEGLDFFYSYSHIINSTVDVKAPYDGAQEGTDTFILRKVPLLGYDYVMGPDDDLDKAARVSEFISELELRRAYIDYCLMTLDAALTIDFKFFNTYGPARSYYVSENELIDSVNLTLEFDLKLLSNNDKIIVDNIKDDIKEFIEDIDELKSLHIPNLITNITTKYRDKIVYFEFIRFNGYGPEYQHIYTKEDDKELELRTPEFLCIQTNSNNTPEITINIK